MTQQIGSSGTGGSVARTGRKGLMELGLALATALLVMVADNLASLGLGPETAVIVTLVVQVGLQGLRRLQRDRSQGIPQ